MDILDFGFWILDFGLGNGFLRRAKGRAAWIFLTGDALLRPSTARPVETGTYRGPVMVEFYRNE